MKDEFLKDQMHLIVFCVFALAPCPDLVVTIFRMHVPMGMKFSFNGPHFSILILWSIFFQNVRSAGLTSALWYLQFDTAFIAANCC